jgi:hypothetical protein
LVTVTVQVPELAEVNTPPLTLHPVAVPFTAVYEKAPVPDPPVAPSVRDDPYVLVVVVNEIAPCMPAPIENDWVSGLAGA